MTRRAYRATNVKNVSINRVKQDLAEGPLWVGLDAGKKEVFVVVRDNAGCFARPLREFAIALAPRLSVVPLLALTRLLQFTVVIPIYCAGNDL